VREWLDRLPDQERLSISLGAALRGRGLTDGPVTVLDRQPTAYASSSPSEIVSCGLEGGRVLQLYCKHAACHGDDDYDHRGDRSYEAMVYREVLEPLRTSTPAFYGSHTDPSTGESLLVIEYLGSCPRVNETAEPGAMLQAARWIGRFHASHEGRLPQAPLRAYREAYYLGWAERTVEFAGPLHRRFSWLGGFCRGFKQVAQSLLAPPQSVIHGEYYPHNILFRDGIVRPIDWESAAIAPGEIDLASLTDRWPEEIVQACEQEYRAARWPDGGPLGFGRRLAAARMYQHLRWLGDRPVWTGDERLRWRFEQLERLVERWDGP
jgi:hypothetical protein